MGWLSDARASALDPRRLEQEPEVRGREVLLLDQGHLDLRAAREVRRDGVTGADPDTAVDDLDTSARADAAHLLDAVATFCFWTADPGRLTPDRLWAGAERRISALAD